MEIYNFIKDSRPVSADFLNLALSNIYAPIVPVFRFNDGKNSHYTVKKFNENYYVYEEENGNAEVRGKISSGLLKKLKEFGITLSD